MIIAMCLGCTFILGILCTPPVKQLMAPMVNCPAESIVIHDSLRSDTIHVRDTVNGKIVDSIIVTKWQNLITTRNVKFIDTIYKQVIVKDTITKTVKVSNPWPGIFLMCGMFLIIILAFIVFKVKGI
jgi:hypothetical protein